MHDKLQRKLYIPEGKDQFHKVKPSFTAELFYQPGPGCSKLG